MMLVDTSGLRDWAPRAYQWVSILCERIERLVSYVQANISKNTMVNIYEVTSGT